MGRLSVSGFLALHRQITRYQIPSWDVRRRPVPWSLSSSLDITHVLMTVAKTVISKGEAILIFEKLLAISNRQSDSMQLCKTAEHEDVATSTNTMCYGGVPANHTTFEVQRQPMLYARAYTQTDRVCCKYTSATSSPVHHEAVQKWMVRSLRSVPNCTVFRSGLACCSIDTVFTQKAILQCHHSRAQPGYGRPRALIRGGMFRQHLLFPQRSRRAFTPKALRPQPEVLNRAPLGRC